MQLPTGNDNVNTVQLLLGVCQIVQVVPIIARGVAVQVRLRSFGSLILWISLRLPPDLLHRWNIHVYKQSAMSKLIFACLWVA